MKFHEFAKQCQRSRDCPCDPNYCSFARCPVLNDKCIKVHNRFDIDICVECADHFKDDSGMEPLCDKHVKYKPAG